jgi:hypothetical protein
MAENRIEELREIISQAAARDAELQKTLEGLAAELLKDLGCAEPPVWAELKASDTGRQVSPVFIMEAYWLRGDLKITVTPEQVCVVQLVIRNVSDGQHEVGLERERSQVVIIDPPDEKHRADAKKKLFHTISLDLEQQIRRRLAFPAT